MFALTLSECLSADEKQRRSGMPQMETLVYLTDTDRDAERGSTRGLRALQQLSVGCAGS